MKKILLIPLLIILPLSQIFPQGMSRSLTFKRVFGSSGNEEVKSFKKTNDDGYIIIGSTTSFGAGGKDMYIIKTDSLGDTLWTRTYGDTFNDELNDIIETLDDNYIMCGTLSGKNTLVKINNYGDTLWTKVIPASFNKIISIENTNENFLLSGTLKCCGSNYTVRCLYMTNTNGDSIWFNAYHVPTNPPGQSQSIGYSITQKNRNEFIVVGSYYAYLYYETRGYVLTVDSLGNILGDNRNDRSHYNDIFKTAEGELIAGGSSNYVHTSYFEFAKLGFWSKSMSQMDVITYCNSATECTNGGYTFAGTRFFGSDQNPQSGGFFIKTDTSGNIIWSKEIPSIYDIKKIHGTKDNGFVLTGNSNDSTTDIVLIKTDSTGYYHSPTNINELRVITNNFILYNNYPNPFNAKTIIKYRLKNSGFVNISIYDTLGRMIKTLINKNQNLGIHQINLDATDLASGVYIYRIKFGSELQYKKMLLIK